MHDATTLKTNSDGGSLMTVTADWVQDVDLDGTVYATKQVRLSDVVEVTLHDTTTAAGALEPRLYSIHTPRESLTREQLQRIADELLEALSL